MNKEEYYLNQDMTSECIQLPNQFQQGDCLIQQNYLSELSNNPEKALHNLGLDTIIEALQNCCSNTNARIDEIINNYNDFKVIDGHSRNMNQLLTKGIYRNCNLGRPYLSETGEQYTCIVLPIKEEFKVCDGIRLQSYEDGSIGTVNIGSIQMQEFYSGNSRITNTYLGSIYSDQAATILLSVAPSRTFGDNILKNNIYPTLSLEDSKEKLIFSQSVNYNRNTISISDLKTFEVQVKAGNTPIKISDDSRIFNWWVFDIRPACGYTPILQVCISQTSGMMYYRMLYTKNSAKFEFPNTLYNDWKGSDYISRKIEELNITVDSIAEDIYSIQENITEIQNQQGVNIKFLNDVVSTTSIQDISPAEVVQEDSDWRNTVYLERYNYDNGMRYYDESYNAYKIKVINRGGGTPEYKWIQISQSLIPDNDLASFFQLSNGYVIGDGSQDLEIGDPYEVAFGKLEGKINNLSHESSSECDCPEWPTWVTEDKPDFGEKNLIETIKLNGEELNIDNNKTVNIQETITSAGDGLKIENQVVKHTNSVNNTPPDTEVLCKIKFDQFGHITSYQEVTINDLATQLLNTGLFEPSSSYNEVESVQITPESVTLTDGDSTYRLTATTYGSDGNKATNQHVTWNSSNTDIASVDNNGLVTGNKTGDTTITATSDNGKIATTYVTVQFSTVYYFSIGTTPVTENNYTEVNGATRSIPEEKLYTSSERVRHYILIPDNKSLNIVDNNISASIPITRDNSAQIPNHIVYYTNGAIGSGATVKIILSQLEN